MIRVFKRAFLVFLTALLSLFFVPSLSTGRRYLSIEPTFLNLEKTNSVISTDKGDKELSVGVILPLSGNYASFGESVLKGILLAVQVFGPGSGMEDEGLSIDIIVKDSQEDPDITARDVEELDREGVIGIIGPLLSRTSVSGASKAQELRIPMISLSQKENLPDIGDYVFRNSLTTSKQVESLARYAIEGLDLESFGIFYPDNPYGKRLMYSFIDEIERLGGEIVRSEAYRDDKTDFGDEIKRLFQITEIEDPDRKGRMIFEPVVDFDALFIPDYFERVGLIAPQLAFYNIKDIQLLGANGWNSSQLIDIGGEFIEGAIFVDGFFLDSLDPVVKEFREDFGATYHVIPGILEAQAFDVARMIIHLLNEEGIRDRSSLNESLYRISEFSGVTGKITFDQRGEAQRELFILRVDNGRIVQIEDEGEVDWSVE